MRSAHRNTTQRRSPAHGARGFTLVETLVAIAILTIAMVGPFYSVQQAIMASYAARDQLIASALAQEGVEFVYFVRNSNYLAGAGWMSNLSTCTGASGCTVDPSQVAAVACPSSGCVPLKLSPSGIYTQSDSYPVTRFTRTVKIVYVSSVQARVTVTVEWTTNRRAYAVTVTENLYNWL